MIEKNVFVLVEIIYHYRHLHLLHISCLSTLPYPRCITQTCASPCSSILNHILLIQGRSSFKKSGSQSYPQKKPSYLRKLGGEAVVPTQYISSSFKKGRPQSYTPNNPPHELIEGAWEGYNREGGRSWTLYSIISCTMGSNHSMRAGLNHNLLIHTQVGGSPHSIHIFVHVHLYLCLYICICQIVASSWQRTVSREYI